MTWGLPGRCLAVVQSLSCIQLFVTPWIAARQASLSFTISKALLRLMSTESVMPSNHLILSHPLLLLPSIFPSIRVFSSESALHIKWSFSFSPSNEYSGWISFRLEWFDLPAVQWGSQESSPTPQFEDISSSVLSLLYAPVHTSRLLNPSTFLCIHPIDFWEFDIETPAKNFDIST